jgi:23S rRNA pseudouridine955/2504/2580 synthase
VTGSNPIDKSQQPSRNEPAVRIEVIDDDAAGQRIDNYLLGRLKGVPKSHVYQILRSGRVRVNKKRVAASYRLNSGDLVRIPPVRIAQKQVVLRPRIPQNTLLLPRILYQDDSIMAIDKPSGLAVHGGSGVSLGVIELLRREFPQQKFLELVHRLDRETSGILLVAKKRKALIGLHEMLRKGQIEKHYFVLAKGDWKDERRHVKARLHKFHTALGERRVAVDDAGQDAHSIFTLIKHYPGASLLDAEIKTGRTHQIRVHLAHLGFPVLGDAKYGDFACNKELQSRGLRRMFLHAAHLIFNHPLTGELLDLKSDLPPELVAYLKRLSL